MDQRDSESTDWEGHPVASELAERVRDVISAAEAAASAIRHEAEQEAQARRRSAEEEARHRVDDARREAEALLAERMRRISELSDTILERGETVLSRLSRAEEVRRELESLVDELGEAAQRLAREVRGGLPGESSAPPVSALRASGEGAGGNDASASATSAGQTAMSATAEPSPSSETPPAQALASEDAASRSSDGIAPAAESENANSSSELRAEASAVAERRAEPPAAGTQDEGPQEVDDDVLAARLVALQMAVAGSNRGEVESHLRRSFEVSEPQSILDDVFGPGTDASKRVAFPSAADS